MTNDKKNKQKQQDKKNKVKKTATTPETATNNGNKLVNKLINKKNKNKNNNNNKNKLKVVTNNTNVLNITKNDKNNNKNKNNNNGGNKKQQTTKVEKKKEEEITNSEDDEKYNLWNPKPTTTATTATGIKSSNLQNDMSEKLKGSRFRWLNETLYTSHSEDAFKEFSQDRSLFDQYHSGFKSQVESWPINPLDLIINDLSAMKQNKRIADLGCGEAMLAERLKSKHTVQSFDLVAVNERVTACDIKNLPLQSESIDIAVFCLSLMGTNFIDFIIEAERVLVKGGILKIAEIESRITDINIFTREIEKHGFKLIKKNTSNQYFTLFEFTKLLQIRTEQHSKNLSKVKKQQLGDDGELEPILKPCLYKKR